jgi:hypothetical protein
MHRRQFLAAIPGLLALGCGKPVLGPVVTAEDRSRIAAERSERETQLARLSRFRVPPGSKRTSAVPQADPLTVAPELKTRLRQTVRFHPRASEEPAPGESKLGGRILWPASEPWPNCEKYRIPLVPVLQLRREDAPNGFAFREGTDLLQVLWSPRDHADGGPKPVLSWRKRSSVNELSPEPNLDAAFALYVPIPCRLFPERLLEFPDWNSLPPSAETLGKLEKWKFEGQQLAGRELYEQCRTAALGTKVGGYPLWLGEARPPSCEQCKWGMDYLLTIASHDWGTTARGAPQEEAPRASEPEAISGWAKASGLQLPGSGHRHVFVCRRCPDWPATAAS